MYLVPTSVGVDVAVAVDERTWELNLRRLWQSTFLPAIEEVWYVHLKLTVARWIAIQMLRCQPDRQWVARSRIFAVGQHVGQHEVLVRAPSGYDASGMVGTGQKRSHWR